LKKNVSRLNFHVSITSKVQKNNDKSREKGKKLPSPNKNHKKMLTSSNKSITFVELFTITLLTIHFKFILLWLM